MPRHFDAWTVDQWYPPSTAICEFADQDLVRRSDKASQEANQLWEEAMGITWEAYPAVLGFASVAAVIAFRAECWLLGDWVEEPGGDRVMM